MPDSFAEPNTLAARATVRVLRPDSPRQAVSFALRLGAPYVAGGTWLQPVFERDQCWPGSLVTLDPGWPGFRGIALGADGLSIGALTTLDELARHPLVAHYLPPLAEMMNQVAGPGVRHLGTVGGNLAMGGDLSALALALDVTVAVVGVEGVHHESLAGWLREHKMGDIISSIMVPDTRSWSVAAEKLGHRERFSPTRATVACIHDGQQWRLAVCGEGGPSRLTLTEAMLQGVGGLSPGDLAAVVESELATLGWQDTALRLAIRRMLDFLRAEVGYGR